MSWSTDFSKLPKTGRVIVQSPNPLTDACLVTEDVKLLRKHDGFYYVAWHPAPEGYAPPKPEQISSDEADKFRVEQIVEDASPRVWISGKTPMQKLIKAVEKRTREIVEWEIKYE